MNVGKQEDLSIQRELSLTVPNRGRIDTS